MLVWFNRPTYIILRRDIVQWLRLAKGWLEPILPYLVVGWRGITTKHPLLSQKPYKLLGVQPMSEEEIAACIVYYGSDKPTYAITALNPLLKITTIVSNPKEGYAVHQLHPFTYFFVLPEPVPPPDIASGGQKPLAELALFLPSIRQQRRKLEPLTTYLSTLLTIYYLLNPTDARIEDVTVQLQGNIMEILQTAPPENFLWAVCLAIAVKYEWHGAIPLAHRAEVQWATYCYYQALHTLQIRR